MKKKACIFHISYYIDDKGKSGTYIRPLKMLHAFKEIGYDVDVVMGYGKVRKKQIARIKRKIRQGKRYEFLYSESNTMPTLLTEKHHLPIYPFLDFQFIKFLKQRNIAIGLFYRDIYWKFSLYNSVAFMKRKIAIFFYQYDLRKYNELLDVLFLPSEKMLKYLPEIKKTIKIKTLPPGTREQVPLLNEIDKKKTSVKNKLNVLYVGGISVSPLYNVEKLIQAIKQTDGVLLTLCCRSEDWNNVKESYQQYLSDKVHVIHKDGEELNNYYKNADVAVLCYPSSNYRNMAFPFKLMEYLSYNIPILITENSVAADFVEKNKIGILCKNTVDSIKYQLTILNQNREVLDKIRERQKSVIADNTWNQRALSVVSCLREHSN